MREGKLEKFEPLLTIACCPYSKTPLGIMTYSELQKSLSVTERKRIPDGTIGAMVSNVSLNAYPMIGPVISFLEQDTLSLSRSDNTGDVSERSQSSSVKQEVKKWYDEFGWKRTATGFYGDTATFSQVGQTAYGFYEMDSPPRFRVCVPKVGMNYTTWYDELGWGT